MKHLALHDPRLPLPETSPDKRTKHHKVDFASAETEDEDGEVSDKARANFREAVPKKSQGWIRI